jgi:hypothetical protein
MFKSISGSIFGASFLGAAVVGAALLFTSAGNAAPGAAYVMAGSNFEVRHQAVVLQALEAKCGYVGNVEVMSSTVEEIRIDQGIVDQKFTTVLRYKQRLDQMIFDTYEANVVSFFYAQYDHTTGNWGAYEVESISCTML